MATQVASLEPTTKQVLGVAVEQTSVPVQSAVLAHATQADPTNLGVAALMATQVASLEPTATQVLGIAVEQTSVPVQSAVLAHATQAEPTNLGVAALMATQVASLEPTTKQVLGVAVEQTSVPVQSAATRQATHEPLLHVPARTCAARNLGMVALMSAQVASLEPTATHVFEIVDHLGPLP